MVVRCLWEEWACEKGSKDEQREPGRSALGLERRCNCVSLEAELLG